MINPEAQKARDDRYLLLYRLAQHTNTIINSIKDDTEEDNYDRAREYVLRFTYINFYEIVCHDTGIKQFFENLGVQVSSYIRNRFAHCGSFEDEDKEILHNLFKALNSDKFHKIILDIMSADIENRINECDVIGKYNQQLSM